MGVYKDNDLIIVQAHIVGSSEILELEIGDLAGELTVQSIIRDHYGIERDANPEDWILRATPLSVSRP